MAEDGGDFAYRPGDEILCSKPFVHVVTEENLLKVCSWCLKREAPPLGEKGKAFEKSPIFQRDLLETKLKKCAGCDKLVYCSSECQVTSCYGKCGAVHQTVTEPLGLGRRLGIS